MNGKLKFNISHYFCHYFPFYWLWNYCCFWSNLITPVCEGNTLSFQPILEDVVKRCQSVFILVLHKIGLGVKKPLRKWPTGVYWFLYWSSKSRNKIFLQVNQKVLEKEEHLSVFLPLFFSHVSVLLSQICWVHVHIFWFSTNIGI